MKHERRETGPNDAEIRAALSVDEPHFASQDRVAVRRLTDAYEQKAVIDGLVFGFVVLPFLVVLEVVRGMLILFVKPKEPQRPLE